MFSVDVPICPCCGSLLRIGDTYCNFCGHNLVYKNDCFESLNCPCSDMFCMDNYSKNIKKKQKILIETNNYKNNIK